MDIMGGKLIITEVRISILRRGMGMIMRSIINSTDSILKDIRDTHKDTSKDIPRAIHRLIRNRDTNKAIPKLKDILSNIRKVINKDINKVIKGILLKDILPIRATLLNINKILFSSLAYLLAYLNLHNLYFEKNGYRDLGFGYNFEN